MILIKSGIEFLSPRNDYLLKSLLSNKLSIANFLTAVIKYRQIDQEDTIFLGQHLEHGDIKDKRSILDIKLKLKTGLVIDIEAQVKSQEFI